MTQAGIIQMMISPPYHSDDDIMMQAALREEYAIYASKTSFPLPYLEWKHREERKAETTGILVW